MDDSLYWLRKEQVEDLEGFQRAYTVLSVVASCFYAFIGIPVCVSVLIVLVREKKLRTHCNCILGSSILFTTIGATNLIWERLLLSPGLFNISDETKALVWTLIWWTFSLSTRINNNCYLLLAVVRYWSICLPTSSKFHQLVQGKSTWKHLVVYSLLNVVPAGIFVTLIYNLSPASGAAFWIKIHQGNITMLQRLDEAVRAQRTPPAPLLLMIGFNFAQCALTIGFFCAILCTSYSATSALIRVSVDSQRKFRPNQLSDTIITELKSPTPERRVLDPEVQSLKMAKLGDKSLPKEEPFRVDLKNEQPDNLDQICSADDQVNTSISAEILSKDLSSAAEPVGAPELEANNVPDNEISPTSWARQLWQRLKMPVMIDDCPFVTPKLGIRKVNLPMTSKSFCISDDDIQCGISLAIQLLMIIVTLFLTAYTISFSKKIVSLQKFFMLLSVCEIIIFLVVLVDPFLCLFLSSNFKDTLFGRS